MGEQGRIVALITARGGSQSIPRKNVALLGGKPLIAWTIEAALQSRKLYQLIVSTDDHEIADIAQTCGASVPFLRPKELAQDDSPHISAVIHAIRWLEKHEEFRPEYLVLLQPTSPFRTVEDIDEVIELARATNAEAVVSVMATHHHPYLTYQLTDQGALAEFIPSDLPYPRRQDLPPAYFANGAIYMNRSDSLLSRQTFYPEGMLGYVMPPERSLQIDSAWDHYLAELIVRDGVGRCQHTKSTGGAQ